MLDIIVTKYVAPKQLWSITSLFDWMYEFACITTWGSTFCTNNFINLLCYWTPYMNLHVVQTWGCTFCTNFINLLYYWTPYMNLHVVQTWGQPTWHQQLPKFVDHCKRPMGLRILCNLIKLYSQHQVWETYICYLKFELFTGIVVVVVVLRNIHTHYVCMYVSWRINSLA